MSNFFITASRKLVVLLSMFFAVTLLTACSQSPESVAYEHAMALINGRWDKAFEYVSTTGMSDSELMEMKAVLSDEVAMERLKSEIQADLQRRGGLDSLSTKLVSQTGDVAIVELVTKFKNGEIDTSRSKLLKESGKWRIKGK